MSTLSASSSPQPAPSLYGMFGLLDDFMMGNVLSYADPSTGLATANPVP